MVNDNFVKVLREVIGDETIDKIVKEEPHAWFELIQKFEISKKSFVLEKGNGMPVDVSIVIYDRIKNGLLESGDSGLKLNNGKLIISRVSKYLNTVLF